MVAGRRRPSRAGQRLHGGNRGRRRDLGGVRSHYIEYLAPAFAGDTLTMLTWVVNFQKVRSLRKYKIIRANDQTIVARAETDWVFVNAKTGRPLKIPDQVKNTLPIVGREMEP
jgi:acyl-CoA thioester hydrolase